jgi:putative transposase
LYGGVSKYLGSIFHGLARERESKIPEGHLYPGHVHMLIEIPPKYAVAQVVGYIGGKSAIAIARRFVERQKSFTGQNFWARG